MARIPKLDAAGKFLAADVNAQIDARTKATMRADLPALADELGVTDFDQVWQSRSGPPQIPWLEPDICDHLESLAAEGVRRVVVYPVGFISDHLEVIWDLDNEAADVAEKLGMEYARADSVGTDPRFITMIADLIVDGRVSGSIPEN